MAPRTIGALLLLLVSGLAAAEDDNSRAAGAELAAKQQKAGADLPPEAELADAPLHILNNATNDIVIANCLESYEIKAGEEIQTTLMTGGFWVLPAGADFNCSLGCADCFYVAMKWSLSGGASARIGFGLGCDADCDVSAKGDRDGAWWRPQGGGIRLAVNGSGSAECTDDSCEAGWRRSLPVDPDSSVVSVTVEGSKLAQQGNATGGEVHADRFGRVGGIGRIGRPGFRRPVFRRPIFRRPIRPIFRRPVFRRPIYRPIYSPIYTPAPACAWCNMYGSGTCWWLCQ